MKNKPTYTRFFVRCALAVAFFAFIAMPAAAAVKPIALSQTTTTIGVGQKTTLEASQGSNLTVSGGAGVVKAVIVKPLTVSLTGVKVGKTKITVCSTDAYCAWVLVTVAKKPVATTTTIKKPASTTPVKKPVASAAHTTVVTPPAAVSKNVVLSRASASVAKWGSTDVLVHSSSTLVATTDSIAVRTAINGNRVTLYGTEEGLATVTICDSTRACATVRVLVTPIATGAFSISQTSVNIDTDTSVWLKTQNGSALTASVNNTWVVGAKVKENFVIISAGSRTGSAIVRVCSVGSDCILVYVTVKQGVSSQTAYGTFKSVTVDVGQSVDIPFPNLYTASYNIIGGPANTSIATLMVNKNTFTVTGKSIGAAVFKLCPTSPDIACGTVGVTVKNNVSCSTSGPLILSESGITVVSGQKIEITASNCRGLVAISESDVVRTGVSGNRITLYGTRVGNTKVKVCDSNLSCSSLVATVKAK